MADKKGKTPLALAMGRHHDKIVQYLKKESRRRVSLLPQLDAWTIVFGPPGKTKGPLLFLVFSIILWGYPLYFTKVLFFNRPTKIFLLLLVFYINFF